MRRILQVSGSLLLLCTFAGCDRDVPTAAGGRGVSATEALPGGSASEDLAGLTLALEDIQSRVLPTLGGGPTAPALADALAELQGTLARPTAGASTAALERATSAATRMQVDTGSLPDYDVVRLVLEQVGAALRARAESRSQTPDVARP